MRNPLQPLSRCYATRCNNCGMASMWRDIVAKKLTALAQSAALARKKFG
jgi:methionine synthase II (cobalamin-independent)